MRGLIVALSAGLCSAFFTLPLRGDTFGSGTNQFVIDFVPVGNAGNADDTGAGGGSYSSPYGGVAYNFRISTYEISRVMIDKATAMGMTFSGTVDSTANQAANYISWYQAAEFVNWLNTSHGFHEAYDLSFDGDWSMNLWAMVDQASTGVGSGTNPYRHKDAFYFLPSEDEWYKAAYHQNDGVTANYWDYPTGGNNVPDGIDFTGDTDYEAAFGGSQVTLKDITDAGTSSSSYGTFGQGGNAHEWQESAADGVNDSASEDRSTRGGFVVSQAWILRSDSRFPNRPQDAFVDMGFRVASAPQGATSDPPVIVTQPWPQTQVVSAGSDATISVGVSGFPPLTVQWYLDGDPIAGGTNVVLLLTSLSPSDSGEYSVVASNPGGSVASDPAILSVVASLAVQIVPRLTLNADIGSEYWLEYANALGPGTNWIFLDAVSITNLPQFYYDDSAIGQPKRFYRLVTTNAP